MERGAAISRTWPQWMKQEEAMKPTIGRIVHYTLTAADAEQINRRRTTRREIAERVPEGKWPTGAQAHIGNEARAGRDYPAMIVAVWTDEFGSGRDGINAQVFLDGNDTFWVTSVGEKPAGEKNDVDASAEGHWRWPART